MEKRVKIKIEKSNRSFFLKASFEGDKKRKKERG